ncbi:MAG: DUF3179 domain-containing protein [bacterium]|nr:DUF3179 domain-containing protein [bacterium]
MKQLLTICILGLLLSSCGEDNPRALFDGDWSIPRDDVLSGGPGVDGIPALTNPEVEAAASSSFLTDDELIVGFKVGNETRAYPHEILDWHEIINDDIGGKSIAINYCPLTGTALGWSREIEGDITTFGVSGLLYNSNLIPYDRKTSSAWSQMLVESVNGDLIGERPETYQVFETTWGTWKRMYPESTVVTRNTGIDRSYGIFPYFIGGRDYRNDSFLLFPVDVEDNRLHNKERVVGIIDDGDAKTYRLSQMTDEVALIHDVFKGTPIVVFGNDIDNYAMIFQSVLADGTQLEFRPIPRSLPVVMEDNEGTRWNVFGEAVSGPREGEKLLPTQSFIGYWFSWGTFYPGAEIGN